jgi:hypothetical protein
VEFGADVRQCLAAAPEVEVVVARPPVVGTAPRGHEPGATELGQVVRHERLRFADEGGQLADVAVAGGEFGQQTPPQRMRSGLEESWWSDDGGCHERDSTSN